MTAVYDLIVIGGGPAGLTAMVYAIRKHLNALLIAHRDSTSQLL